MTEFKATLAKPTQFVARLKEKKELNHQFVLYVFELESPHRFEFLAGQYVSLVVSPIGERRSYSICSSPDLTNQFELFVQNVSGGKGTEFLANLKFGDTINGLGPLGRFIVDDSENKVDDGVENTVLPPLVFVATGSGLAPLRSMILDELQRKKTERQIVLHWGLHSLEDLIWQDEFAELSQIFPNFKFHPVISAAPTEWVMCHGRVTDCLRVHELPNNADYYLCGNQKMITDVSALLQERGVVASKIHLEKFY